MSGSKSTRIVLILFIVLILLFAATVGLGSSHAEDRPGSTISGDSFSPRWAERLRTTFAPGRNVRAGDVLLVSPSSCRGTLPGSYVVAPGGRCTLTVQGAAPYRLELRLRLQEGTALTTRTRQEIEPGKFYTASETIGPIPASATPEPAGPDILRRGATVTLECVGLAACRAALEP